MCHSGVPNGNDQSIQEKKDSEKGCKPSDNYRIESAKLTPEIESSQLTQSASLPLIMCQVVVRE